MKKTAYVLSLIAFLGSPAFAEEKWVDRNEDGRKETKEIYRGKELVRVEEDQNGDGKMDGFVDYKSGKRFKSESDRDFDGRIDRWTAFDAEGKMKLVAKDTNGDGKPDAYQDFLKGREVVLRENDKNFDGRIDRRALTQWDLDKSITVYDNNRAQKISTPGYATLWLEEDKDFDGKIDAYREKGKKDLKKRLGEDIEKRPTVAVP